MADPKKVTYYGDPTLEVGITDRMTGEGTVYTFTGGKLETSDPQLIEHLERMADTPSHPVSRKPTSEAKK